MKTLSGKAQALSGLLLYRASSGSIDNEYFASILQQIYHDKIKNIHVDPGTSINSLAEVDLDKLVKKKRFNEKTRTPCGLCRRDELSEAMYIV